MELFDRIALISKTGDIMKALSKKNEWTADMPVSERGYEKIEQVIQKAHIHNGWFTEKAVRDALGGIAGWLTEDQLEKWAAPYFRKDETKKIAIIMAGNIPLVGFHDFLSVFMSGYRSLIKLSSDDRHLFPAILEIMREINPGIYQWVEVRDSRLNGFDAVIATGSNNSANYFESYFGKYPHIIRKNRHSVAVLNGSEKKEDIQNLGKDVFTYFGLGCRNVTQILIPNDFNINRIFEGFYDFKDIINHNKYANNYDYNKAIHLMNQEKMLDNGFLLLKEDDQLASPLGMLHYKRYKDQQELEQILQERANEIQVVVGQDYIPFGQSQNPGIEDYADCVNTLEFLAKI
jgi:hypothetical protein